ncbi:prepilin-type N-terminal cleavage/methylation domain-containing protein [Candidatus Saccharibacteria bacterium]|nr:prepilin-type N-terminal cleavage/methylation domain-containing protein [Candidatus Saccharibacteria bacterium]MBI2285804.1 prepilin-type N-terminal cleavage/methylation domain-containing protein [Candidatus Saccharibacteria bacterium]
MLALRLFNRQKNHGFTVMELMIATTIFSILLLLSLAGFLQIGQLFYKGVNITRTSDTGKQAISSIKDDISFDTGTTVITRQGPYPISVTIPSGTTTYSRYYFCAGPNRYSFVQGRLLNSEEAAQELKSATSSFNWYKFGLLKEKLTVNGCPNPFTGTPIVAANTTELLGDKMRLSNLTIQPVLGSLYTLNVHIAYGIDEVLTSPPTSTTVKCQSGANFSRYCFVTDVRTTVRKGFQP